MKLFFASFFLFLFFNQLNFTVIKWWDPIYVYIIPVIVNISFFFHWLCLCTYCYSAFPKCFNWAVKCFYWFFQMLKHIVHPIDSTVSLCSLPPAALSSCSPLAGLSSRLDAQLMSQDLSSPLWVLDAFP